MFTNSGSKTSAKVQKVEMDTTYSNSGTKKMEVDQKLYLCPETELEEWVSKMKSTIL